MATAIFNSSVWSMNVSAGSLVSFDFSSYTRNTSDVEMTAQFSSMTSWIQFDSQAAIMSGTVPPTAPYSNINVILTATPKTSHASTSLLFALFVGPTTSRLFFSSSSVSYSPSSTSTRATSWDTSAPSSVQTHKNIHSWVIVAITIPIALLALSIIFALCYYRQRRRAAKE